MKDNMMFIPLSVDKVQSNKQLYFATNGKLAGLFSIIIVYFILAAVLLRGSTSIIPLLLLTGMFLIGIIYFVRFVMFEESRLKKSVRDSDLNRLVKPDHFNTVQKVRDNGLIEYQYRVGIRHGYVVYVRRGSKVGVPDGFMEQQVNVLDAFLQEVHKMGWSYDKIEMEKIPELSGSTIAGLNKLRKIEDDTKRNYHRLQLETIKEYMMSDSQEVGDYYIIYNNRAKTLRRFRDNLDSIIRRTLHTSVYLSNSRVLDKNGVRKYLATYFLLDGFDIDDIRKNIEYKELSEFGRVVRAFDSEGNEELMLAIDDESKSSGEGIDDMIDRMERIETNKFERKIEDYQRGLDRLIKRKDKDLITFAEFIEKRNTLYASIFDSDDVDKIDSLDLLKVHMEVYGQSDEDNISDVISIEDDEDVDVNEDNGYGAGFTLNDIEDMKIDLEDDEDDFKIDTSLNSNRRYK